MTMLRQVLYSNDLMTRTVTVEDILYLNKKEGGKEKMIFNGFQGTQGQGPNG